MVDKTIAVYSIIDDILIAIGHYEDKRRTMNGECIIFCVKFLLVK